MTEPRRRDRSLRRSFALVVGLVALATQLAVAPAVAAPTWTKNLYDARAFLYQDPYPTACTAATTMIMLNTIAYRHSGGDAFRWTPYRVKNNTTNRRDNRDMTSILWWERAHDTLSVSGDGSDGHGWRNALNTYGWGGTALADPASRVYDDRAFTSYDAAVHAAVRAIAQFEMPVGIVSWAGRHAQVMTGFVVTGENPRVSDAFTVLYVFVSDPLYSDHYVNAKISNAAFRAGALHVRFQAYREIDSPYDDGYTVGWRRSSVSSTVGPSEWYRRWVIIVPIRGFVTPTDPILDPGPSASPSPGPSADPSAGPSAGPSADPSPSTGTAAAPSEAAPSDAPPSAAAPSASDSPGAPSPAPSAPDPSAGSSPAG